MGTINTKIIGEKKIIIIAIPNVCCACRTVDARKEISIPALAAILAVSRPVIIPKIAISGGNMRNLPFPNAIEMVTRLKNTVKNAMVRAYVITAKVFPRSIAFSESRVESSVSSI